MTAILIILVGAALILALGSVYYSRFQDGYLQGYQEGIREAEEDFREAVDDEDGTFETEVREFMRLTSPPSEY